VRGFIKNALFILLLAACSPVPAGKPPSTPEPWSVTFTPSLQPLTPALQHCALQQPEIALLIDEIPAPNNPTENADLSIRLGMPAGGAFFSAALGFEQIVVVVNRENSQASLDSTQLSALFSGATTDWEQVSGKPGPIHTWTYLPGDDARQIFDAAILPSEKVTSQAALAPDPAAMIQGIASDPGAIGYLPRAWLTDTVRPLSVQDIPANSLRQPILAYTKSEPQGAGRAFLACLQSGSGQDMIREDYSPVNQGG
jgi:hypothetical protein